MTSQTFDNRHQVVIYLQVHQPRRLRAFQSSETSQRQGYFDDELTEMVVKRVAEDCYLPVNDRLLKLITTNPNVKLCFSIPGETLDLFEKYAPEVLESFANLSATGSVEFLSETYHHSLSSLISAEEFQAQSVLHNDKIYHHFGMRPTVFRNTELIYNDDIGSMIASMGFKGVICEGVQEAVDLHGTKSLHVHPASELTILLRDVSLSSQIHSRFGAGDKALTVDKFISALEETRTSDAVTLCGLNYEIFADHLNRDAGMVNFFADMLTSLSEHQEYNLAFASDVVTTALNPKTLSIPAVTSWSNPNSLENFLGNDMQQEAFGALKALIEKVMQVADENILNIWRSLQCSDHFYYMATGKSLVDHYPDLYTNYPSPYEAFINYMNVLNDFALNLQDAPLKEPDDEHAKNIESERQHPTIPMWAMQKEHQQAKAPELNV